MTKYLFLLPVIFSVMLISGCVGPGQGAAGAGLVITRWQAVPTSVESGQTVTFSLEVQNQGDAIAKNVRAQLFNIADWGGTFFVGSLSKDLPDVSPRDVQAGVPGGTAGHEWSIEAPSLPQGITQTYRPAVRVYYEYQTNAIYRIKLVPENEFRVMIEQGKAITPQPVTQTAGPLSIEVMSRGSVVETKKYGLTQRIIPIGIKITNVGGGVVRPDEHGWSAWGWGSVFTSQATFYPVEMKIELPIGMSLVGDCSSYASPNKLGLFSGGKERTITCEISVSQFPDYPEDRDITITLRYPYYVENEVTVTVQGARRATTGWGI